MRPWRRERPPVYWGTGMNTPAEGEGEGKGARSRVGGKARREVCLQTVVREHPNHARDRRRRGAHQYRPVAALRRPPWRQGTPQGRCACGPGEPGGPAPACTATRRAGEQGSELLRRARLAPAAASRPDAARRWGRGSETELSRYAQKTHKQACLSSCWRTRASCSSSAIACAVKCSWEACRPSPCRAYVEPICVHNRALTSRARA